MWNWHIFLIILGSFRFVESLRCKWLGVRSLTILTVLFCFFYFSLSFIIHCILLGRDFLSLLSYLWNLTLLHLWPNFFGKTNLIAPNIKYRHKQIKSRKSSNFASTSRRLFDLLLSGCDHVERNSARHRRMETNGESSLRSTCGDMLLQLVTAQARKDKHICWIVVLHRIAFISKKN